MVMRTRLIKRDLLYTHMLNDRSLKSEKKKKKKEDNRRLASRVDVLSFSCLPFVVECRLDGFSRSFIHRRTAFSSPCALYMSEVLVLEDMPQAEELCYKASSVL